MKEEINKLKEAIKEMAYLQKEEKSNRKGQSEGYQNLIFWRKDDLRHYYHVYNEVRNKPLPEYKKVEVSERNLKAIKNKFKLQ